VVAVALQWITRYSVFQDDDLSSVKTNNHYAVNKHCACKKSQSIMPEKSKNARPKYGRSVSACDLSVAEPKNGGVVTKDKKKCATLGSVPAIDGLGKSHTKTGYSRLLYCWKRLKKSLTSTGSKDGSKVTTVVATPGQGPDRPQEVSYTDTKVIGNGSFGVVYQAKLCETNEFVAIKKVLQDKRFKNRELQIMRKLEHCNIVKLKYFFYSSGDKVSRPSIIIGTHIRSHKIIKTDARVIRVRQLSSVSVLRRRKYLRNNEFKELHNRSSR
jgi:hypothetical protein